MVSVLGRWIAVWELVAGLCVTQIIEGREGELVVNSEGTGIVILCGIS